MVRANLKRCFKLKTPSEALQTLIDNIKITTLSSETKIEKAAGRVLAEDIVAPVNIPSRNVTFVDGYAVRYRDTMRATPKVPVNLIIVGKLFPNNFHSSIKISSGQTAYVTCGSTVPKGADGVIKSEQTIFNNGNITVKHSVQFGQNIAYAGEDIKKGNTVFRKGWILRPQDIGLIAGMGIKQVNVNRKPKMAVISVGDELAEFKRANPTEKILNNYALLISGLAIEIGVTPLRLGVVPDDSVQIQDRIAEGLRKADIVGTIGGCSVGLNDVVPDAINALGSPGVVVHGVSIKPGHVIGVGVVRGKPIVMMPGHIVSATVAFYLFIVPLVNRYLGFGGENTLPIIKAKLTKDINSEPLHTFLRVSISKDAGKIVAKPVHGGSNTITTLVGSNGFTVLPPKKSFKKGDELEFTLFSRYEYARFASC